MHQHALNAILQRNSTRITSPARTSQLELDIAIVKPPKLDIATILLNRRPDPRLQQLLNHTHHLVIILVIRQAILLRSSRLLSRLLLDSNNRLTRGNRLCDERKDFRPDMRPVCVAGLGDGDEVCAVKHRRHPVNVHQLRGQLRRVRRRNRRARVQVLDKGRRQALGQHAVVGQELERVGVGGCFGLDEDGALAGACWAEARML